MNTRQIEFFIALAQTRSIRRAAGLCGAQPSTVSSAVKELEKELLVPLYQKSTHGIELTNEGYLFYDAAETLLLKLHRCQQQIYYRQVHLSGNLQLAALSGIMSYILPDFLISLANQFPALHIQHHTLSHEDITAQLADGCLHLGYTHLTGDGLNQCRQRYPKLVFQPILECNYVYMASKQNPLAKKTTLSDQDLANASLSIYIHNSVEDNPIFSSLPCKEIFFTNSELPTNLMMRKHNYLTLIPYYNQKLVAHSLNIRNNVILFPKKLQTNYITAIYAKQSAKSALIEQLLQLQRLSNQAISIAPSC